MFLMLTALLSVSAAFAQQSGSGASTTDTDPYGWKVNWVPFYLWMSGLNGNVGVRGHVAPVDASFSDVFDKLNIGYMTTLDVRYDRVGVLTDLVYIDLGADKAFPNTRAGTMRGGRQQRKANAASQQQAAQKTAQQQQQEEAQAKAAEQQNLDSFKRAFSACMDARGYSVK